MNSEKLYAIIDGASEEELMPMLAEFDPPVACLYAPPVQPDLINIAPYVVLVDDDVKAWLDARETPWGIYITTTEDLKSIRQHLRKYLYVRLPDEEKPVFFRFYDPRNIWSLTSVLNPWQLHSFLGPINEVSTTFGEKERSDNFAEIRSQFPHDAMSNKPLLEINEDQYKALTAEFEERYIHKLASQIPAHEDIEPVDFASDIFNYLKRNDIEDDRNIRGITTLLTSKEYFSLDDMPQHYKDRLESQESPGYYRAERLLIDELGMVPA